MQGRATRAALLGVTLLLAQPAIAIGSSVVIATGYTPNLPAARIQTRADYVAVPINIHSDAKDAIKRFDQIETTLREISSRVKPHPDLSVRPGVVSLSPQETSKSFSSYASGNSSAQLYVLAALKPDATVFTVAKRIHQVVAAAPLTDGTRVSLGNTMLGMDEPEKFRTQLLGLIAKSAAEAKKLLGASGPAEVDGLENAVAVMQANDSEVVVFINYRTKIHLFGGTSR
jgi:hypothetical protein